MTKKAAHRRGRCALHARPSRAPGFIGVGPTAGPRPLGGAALGLGLGRAPTICPGLAQEPTCAHAQEARLPGHPPVLSRPATEGPVGTSEDMDNGFVCSASPTHPHIHRIYDIYGTRGVRALEHSSPE